MRKKKHIKIFKEGMEAGAKPFEKKFETLKDQQDEISQKASKIISQQNKQRKLTDMLISEIERQDDKQSLLDSDMQKQGKAITKQKRELDKIELLMPAIDHKCNKCGKPIHPEQIVCCNCGEISKNIPFDLYDLKIEEECHKEVETLSKTIIKNSNADSTWIYPELNEQFIKMKKIQEIAAINMKDKSGEERDIYKQIYRKAKSFFGRYEDRKIEIAIVGTVKAGKSSLINAIVGSNIASVKATPETSVLVKYRTTPCENYLKIKFYTEKEWERLWSTAQTATTFLSEYNETGAENIKYEYLGKKTEFIECEKNELRDLVMEWTRSDSPKHFFVKEIEVGYESEDMPHDIYLVDTPGLSDPVKYRSDITRRYISKSDWILACITCEKLSEQPEFQFLSRVIANKNGDVSKIFVIATKKDILIENERILKRNEFLERLKQLYSNPELAISRFSFVAAECHVFAKTIQSGRELEDDQRKKMRKMLADMDMEMGDLVEAKNLKTVMEYAEVESLFEKMKRIVINSKREHLIREITLDYNKTMSEINTLADAYLIEMKNFIQSLISENNDDNETINELEESNKQIQIIQKKIKNLKDALEIEIAANSSTLKTKG